MAIPIDRHLISMTTYPSCIYSSEASSALLRFFFSGLRLIVLSFCRFLSEESLPSQPLFRRSLLCFCVLVLVSGFRTSLLPLLQPLPLPLLQSSSSGSSIGSPESSKNGLEFNVIVSIIIDSSTFCVNAYSKLSSSVHLIRLPSASIWSPVSI